MPCSHVIPVSARASRLAACSEGVEGRGASVAGAAGSGVGFSMHPTPKNVSNETYIALILGGALGVVQGALLLERQVLLLAARRPGIFGYLELPAVGLLELALAVLSLGELVCRARCGSGCQPRGSERFCQIVQRACEIHSPLRAATGTVVVNSAFTCSAMDINVRPAWVDLRQGCETDAGVWASLRMATPQPTRTRTRAHL